MSLFRCVLLVMLISFSAAFGLLFFGSKMGYEEFRGGYAVLSADALEDESVLLSLLETDGGHFAQNIVSESSQWVYLDEFDTIKKIPLNKYHERVFSFDPRNDGYADKLKEIFIEDGKRFIYMPLHAGNWNVSLLNKQLSDLLGGIQFSAEYFGAGRPLLLFFASYAAASFLLFIFCLIKRKQSGGIACILALIPVFSSLAFFGAYGIACAAVFFALFIMLKELIFEFSILSGSSARKNNFKIKSIFIEFIFPYKFYWLLILLTPAVFYTIMYLSQIKILFLLSMFAAALFVFLLSYKIMSVSKRTHKRFTPVLIIGRSHPEFAFPVYLLPFAAAAVFVLFASPYMTAPYYSEKKFDKIITEKDYHDHINHQAFFSVRKIDNSTSDFPEFFYDTDSLPSMSPARNKTVNFNDYPSFPLKHLMEFFNDVNSSHNANPAGGGHGSIYEKLPLLVMLLFIIPVFFAKKRTEQTSKIRMIRTRKQYFDNAGKLRSKGINWNKKSLYNNKNNLSIQKDA